MRARHRCDAETLRRTRCARLGRYGAHLSAGYVVLCSQHHKDLDAYGSIRLHGQWEIAWSWPGQKCECWGLL